jgi:hypothetical protein
MVLGVEGVDRRRPDHQKMMGKRDEMAKAWLNWGKENGYI